MTKETEVKQFLVAVAASAAATVIAGLTIAVTAAAVVDVVAFFSGFFYVGQTQASVSNKSYI